jgi:hypothetical protein
MGNNCRRLFENSGNLSVDQNREGEAKIFSRRKMTNFCAITPQVLFPYDRRPQDHQKHQNDHDKDNSQSQFPGLSGFPGFLSFHIRYSFLGCNFKFHPANLFLKYVYRFFILSF